MKTSKLANLQFFTSLVFMSKEILPARLLGFTDLFPSAPRQTKDAYGKRIGKDLLYKTACHFLSYFRTKSVPANKALIQEWFTFNEIKYYQLPYYHYVITSYNVASNDDLEKNLKILNVESFLKLFTWLATEANIPETIQKEDPSLTLPLFQICLLFNDEVLKNFEIARNSAKKTEDDKSLQRLILAMAFPQNDFLNADYAQLLVTQFYKAIKALDFMSQNEKYKNLLSKFLQEFHCDSKEEYLKSVGAAIVLGLQNMRAAWTTLNVPLNADFEKSCAILEKLCMQEHDESLFEQNDYFSLRSNPLRKIKKGEYMIIYDLFLIKKLYTGLVFRLSKLTNEDQSIFKENFLGAFRIEFSEEILLYDSVKHIYGMHNAVQKTGAEFKNVKLEREPDYYVRNNDRILLFESKDFFIKGETKLSYDFNKIETELKNGRLEKAIEQLLRNIERVFLKQLILDANYDTEKIAIFPIVVVHDALYSCPALNFWINHWLDDGLKELKGKEELLQFDFTSVMPVTVVEIDTLILYQDQFQTMELDFENLLIQYHEHVQFRKKDFQTTLELEKHALQSAIPFAEFARQVAHEKNIQIDHKNLTQLLRQYNIR